MKILHLISSENQNIDLLNQLVTHQKTIAENEVTTVDLDSNSEYAKIVEQIFESDSVQVW